MGGGVCIQWNIMQSLKRNSAICNHVDDLETLMLSDISHTQEDNHADPLYRCGTDTQNVPHPAKASIGDRTRDTFQQPATLVNVLVPGA